MNSNTTEVPTDKPAEATDTMVVLLAEQARERIIEHLTEAFSAPPNSDLSESVAEMIRRMLWRQDFRLAVESVMRSEMERIAEHTVRRMLAQGLKSSWDSYTSGSSIIGR